MKTRELSIGFQDAGPREDNPEIILRVITSETSPSPVYIVRYRGELNEGERLLEHSAIINRPLLN